MLNHNYLHTFNIFTLIRYILRIEKKLDELYAYIKTLANDITTCFNNSVIQIKLILNKDVGYKDNFEDLLNNITSIIHNPIKIYLSKEI